jgi:hypothetical protein
MALFTFDFNAICKCWVIAAMMAWPLLSLSAGKPVLG